MLGEWKAFDPEQVRKDFDRISALPAYESDGNASYHRHLTRHIPTRINRALDVGCGTGTFTRVLADRATRVDAIDLSPGMIEAARRNLLGRSNVRFEVADLLETPFESDRYDVIATLATLHHVPLELALNRLVTALAPGGTLLVLDLLDATGIKELPRNGIAWLALRLKRLAQGRPLVPADAERAWNDHGRRDRYDPWPEIVRTYRRLLPGTRLKRHLLWRYSAVWRKPPLTSGASRA